VDSGGHSSRLLWTAVGKPAPAALAGTPCTQAGAVPAHHLWTVAGL
jgi:hypothetical protein